MMRKRNLAKLALLCGALVLLQTSCSKEKTNDQQAKVLKTTTDLTRTHSEVTTFQSEFENWIAGDPHSYGSLSVDDAEWMLEACFNFENRFYGDGSQQAVVKYEELDNLSITVSGGEVSPDALFGAYEDLLDLTASVDSIVPMTDIRFEDGDPFVIHIFVARLDKYRSLFTRKPYTDHFAVGPVTNGPQGPRSICGNPGDVFDNSTYAPQMLTFNLGLTYDPPINNGYHTDVYLNTYAEDPFDSDPYEGFYDPNLDYELSIWGIHQSVNPASTATGQADECLSQTQLNYYEDEIEDLMAEQTPPGLRKHNVKVVGKGIYNGSYSPSSPWYYHELQFTWSKFTVL